MKRRRTVIMLSVQVLTVNASMAEGMNYWGHGVGLI